MRALMLVLCVSVASGARIDGFNGRLVQENNNYDGVDVSRQGRQHSDHRHGPRDGPIGDLGPNRARPYGERYGEADRYRPGRPPGGPPPPPPERRGFGDRSNEIADENIDRIRTTIYSNMPTDRQLYANTYKHERNNFNNRKSENNNENREAGDRSGVSDSEQPIVNGNQSQGVDARTISDENTQQEADTIASSHGARNDAAVKSVQSEKPVTSRNATDGRGVVEESTWVWSPTVDTSTAAATMPDDLNNRASFTGDNCPTGQIRIEDKCVETH